ncbi:MAG: MBL fold metallo-hydrolase [Syntrophomonadaceae bacterium]|jgi:L-ascorbate metabolism protein UlaG (beta-lactamase superfamily)|nr:MBL fold metallo-hydrolase [Syntrophomonadaceae bacterium]
MQMFWLGHASFFVESGGKKLITDPFDEKLGYPVWEAEVDVATVSHDHWDHCAVDRLKGSPIKLQATGEFNVAGFKISGFATYHDQSEGKERGSNIIFKIETEGITLLHLGDLGHQLSPEQYTALGKIDLLMIPVGGVYTVDAREAYDIVQAIKPRIVIPMHYHTPHLCFELAPVEEFTCQFEQVIKQPYLKINADNLPETMEIIILDYSSRLTVSE